MTDLAALDATAQADLVRTGVASPAELVEAAVARTAAVALGRTPRAVRLPAAVLRAAGAVGGTLARLTGSAEMLTQGKVREILHPDWSADPNLPAPSDLPQATIPLETGLAEMAAWARAAGKL